MIELVLIAAIASEDLVCLSVLAFEIQASCNTSIFIHKKTRHEPGYSAITEKYGGLHESRLEHG